MRVAVLGLGHMGVPIAERVEQAGHELSVWNRSSAPAERAFTAPQRGIAPLAAATPTRGQHADLVVTMLANDAAVRAVTLGRGRPARR